jgi:hypothetical protein
VHNNSQGHGQLDAPILHYGFVVQASCAVDKHRASNLALRLPGGDLCRRPHVSTGLTATASCRNVSLT